MILTGFGFNHFRSFGDNVARIGPCPKITLLAGSNNSGKSNVLTFLRHHFLPRLRSTVQGKHWSLDGLDRHQGKTSAPYQLLLCSDAERPIPATLYKQIPQEHRLRVQMAFTMLLKSPPLCTDGRMSWLNYEASAAGNEFTLPESLIKQILAANRVNQGEIELAWRFLTSQSGGGALLWVRQLLERTSPAKELLDENHLKFAFVPAIRTVALGEGKGEDLSGLGLIDRLAKLQNPGPESRKDRARFDAIVSFLRTVTGDSEAMLEVPYDRDTLLVHMNGRTLPLASLGTGIHEVVILAAAASVHEDTVVCIEEPELHLHPLLQRKLLHYLGASTSNQYFMTTHSAHLLEAPQSASYHIKLEGGSSTVTLAHSPVARAAICADLGYMASDLVQTNCIIWVEGPSDRLLIRSWLTQHSPSLLEGTHYSLMFYGGRLLCHLSPTDPEIDEFISLRRLNRNMAIVIDSDKSTPRTHLSATKRRVIEALDDAPGFAWTTKGRTIENYIPAANRLAVLKSLDSGIDRLAEPTSFGRPLAYTRPGSRRVYAYEDKVRFAREASKSSLPLSELDLRTQINRIAAFIKASNATP